MNRLSKTKILAFRQCPKQLWLTVHKHDAKKVSEDAQDRYAVGNAIGEMARNHFGAGEFIDIKRLGLAGAVARTAELLHPNQRIYEAAFLSKNSVALADVIDLNYRMVEVKASASIKPYHIEDTAIQSFIAKNYGVPLSSVSLMHVNRDWVYQGNGYNGLLIENDVTQESLDKHDDVSKWIDEAQNILEGDEPPIKTGAQCSKPYDCVYEEYCLSQEKPVEYPVKWLPRIQAKALKSLLESGVSDLRDVSDDLLNDLQLRVKNCTLSGDRYFNATGAREELEGTLPVHFLDFETVHLTVPMWIGTRPFQQIPFQFSLHHIEKTGELTHDEFLDLTGEDPSEKLAKTLINLCGLIGSIFVYNAGFEVSCIKNLAIRFPDLSNELLSINSRIVDLYPIIKQHYYHPAQKGSWSLKKVLPTIAPDLQYHDLEISNGELATRAFLLAIQIEDKMELRNRLLEYCKMDTLGLVHIWLFLRG